MESGCKPKLLMNRKGNPLRTLLLTVLTFALLAPLSAQAQDPAQMKMKATQNVQLAQRLMEQARQLVQGAPNRSSLQTALSLYVQAGQLMEESAGLFRSLIPHGYASQQDVQNAEQALGFCLESIQKIKQAAAR